MLKIFHNNFFENLSDPIPPFFTTKKFGLLIEALTMEHLKLIFVYREELDFAYPYICIPRYCSIV